MTGERDQLVRAMPFLGMRRDLPVGKAAHLVANHFQCRVVDPELPERGLGVFGEPGAEPQASGARCC